MGAMGVYNGIAMVFRNTTKASDNVVLRARSAQPSRKPCPFPVFSAASDTVANSLQAT